MDKVRVTLTHPDGSTTTLPGGLAPYAAQILTAAVTNDRDTPKPPPGDSFDDHLESIAQLSRFITHFEAGREEQIAAADTTGGPHADRKALGIAAGMPRSRLYRILERFGRPTNRKQTSA
ncbi:hypothetical protein ABZZ74_23130 [Streptomyces sp. NPDC006476]|uniref:hypothetical protein n=1 Tax=Streptomyces sp. NPDC006476 TaxID=3157175 RepID=UPI0033A74CBF